MISCHYFCIFIQIKNRLQISFIECRLYSFLILKKFSFACVFLKDSAHFWRGHLFFRLDRRFGIVRDCRQIAQSSAICGPASVRPRLVSGRAISVRAHTNNPYGQSDRFLGIGCIRHKRHVSKLDDRGRHFAVHHLSDEALHRLGVQHTHLPLVRRRGQSVRHRLD